MQPPSRVRLAVDYLEERESRLASCDAGWGACALVSRSLHYRRQNEAKRRKRLAARASAGSVDVAEVGSTGTGRAGA